MIKRKLMLGNEAIARGLVENGCQIATAYPGTPSSEILPAVAQLKSSEGLNHLHVQWSINEKVAFEIAYTGSIAGLRSCVAMKQVGLNVASDPFMSAAYLGVKGGFLVISADDPGPHSSQTEQDSRLYALSAKIPVLDPRSPEQAKELICQGFLLSEAFEIPVMIRPTTRVCHARQDVEVKQVQAEPRTAVFEKNPMRWAATPKFRYKLHNELEEKLDKIANWPGTAPLCLLEANGAKKAIITSGVSAAHALDCMRDLNTGNQAALYQVLQPYPLHLEFIDNMLGTYDEILVLEESAGVIEMQLADRYHVKGRNTGYVPATGELLPEIIEDIIARFLSIQSQTFKMEAAPGRRPTLCAGCPHRAAFFAIKKAAPKGIYTSDIGCYTLGLNLGAVDTVLCMGAAISQASGFATAYKNSKQPPVVATIGDSTFFHAGIPPLVDAVVQKAPILVVILDNRTTAMTGNQPTPASGFDISGNASTPVDIGQIVKGCGIQFCKTIDPMDTKTMIPLLKEGLEHAKVHGPAVVISQSPCLLTQGKGENKREIINVAITDTCDGCGYCTSHFECPALSLDSETETMSVNPVLCSGCGVCIHVCPKKSIVPVSG